MRESRYHVLISVPTRGLVTCQTASRLEAVRDRSPGMRPILYQPGAASVAYNRNLIVKWFLESDAEVLVMVDDDIVPPLDFLDALLPIPEGFGMVGIPYPIPDPKSGVPMHCVYELDDELGIRAADMEFGLNECDAIATGCVAIRREALEYLTSNCFRFDANPDSVIHGEDIIFCQDLREAGWKIGYTADAGFCDHIRVTSLEPIVEVLGMLMQRANTITAPDEVMLSDTGSS